MSQWQVQSFPSGTVIVIGHDGTWLDIHAGLAIEKADSDGEYPTLQAIKYRMANDVAKCLNGGERPTWIDDMIRVNEEHLLGAEASSITAIGPTVKDESHPNGWDFRDDQAAKDMRARLIDKLWVK